MTFSRKDFLKKACISGACLCGFSSLATASANSRTRNYEMTLQDNQSELIQEWVSNLLSNLNGQFKKTDLKQVLKKNAFVHYKNLNMEEMLATYEGNLEKFIVFIEEKWGWKINYDKTAGILIADENKNFCVCPMVSKENKIDLSIICYCSEGFAEMMFSKIAKVPVKATVVASIRRGDKSCKYKIELIS